MNKNYSCLSKIFEYTTWVLPLNDKLKNLKKNYAHVIPDPTKRTQGVV